MTDDFGKEKIVLIQQAVRLGNSAAFTTIVKHYQRFVFHICKNILRSTEDAEEVTQDVFIKVYWALDTYKGESRFSTWLYRIAHNLSLNKLTKIARNPVKIQEWQKIHLEIPSLAATSWEQLAWLDRKKFIAFALERLSAEENEMITLYYMHEQSMQEIAEITGLEANTCKVRVFRARKKMEVELQRLLKKEVEDL